MPGKTRSCLIHIPQLPMSHGDLRPKRALGTMLRRLAESGHESRAWDFATLDVLAELSAKLPAQPAPPLASPELRRQLEHALVSRVLHALVQEKHLDFVVFLVEKRAAFPAVYQVAKALREMRPNLHLLLAGAYAERYGETLLNAAKCFDAALLETPEDGVLAWAESINTKRCAAHLPNIALLGSKHAPRRTPHRHGNVLPLYDGHLYPAAHNGQFLHFDVPMSRMPAQLAREACGVNTAQLWVNRSKDLHAEISAIAGATGSRALHFTGAFTPAADSRDLFSGFLGGSAHLRFSRDAHVHHVDSFSVNEWTKAGGHSVHFKVPSGSQRLLEDFYGECFGVSQVETVIRGCRDAGLYTVMHMQHPCPWDDYHTREETVRLLRRSQPDAVCFDAPEPVPGTAWYHDAKSHGFKIDYKRFGKWAAAEGKHAQRGLSYRMQGWSPRKMENEQRMLLDACAELGVPVGIDAQTALAAQLSGFGGDAAAFHARLTHATATFDIGALAELMRAFNTKAQTPKTAEMPPVFTTYRIAVGN